MTRMLHEIRKPPPEPAGTPVPDDGYPDSYHLVCEELVRQIRDARRWCAVEEAWEALLRVQQMGEDMRREHEHLCGDTAMAMGRRAPVSPGVEDDIA